MYQNWSKLNTVFTQIIDSIYDYDLHLKLISFNGNKPLSINIHLYRHVIKAFNELPNCTCSLRE